MLEQDSGSPVPAEDMAKWEAEFHQLMSAQRDELDYGAFMQEAWENGIGDLSEDSHLSDNFIKFDDQGIPHLDGYVFGEYRWLSLLSTGQAGRKEQ